MELKSWTYEEFPEFSGKIEDAKTIKTSGEEIGVRYLQDLLYAKVDGTELHLQILQPYTRNHPEKKYPCIVWVQGSAWMQQDVKGNLPMYSQLAARGYVVAIVQYRHSGIAAFPAQIQDAKNAIRYVRKYAKEYGVDSDNILVGGDSSGGHTAVFCGIVKDNDELDYNLFPGISAEVKGVIDYYGAVSLMYEDGFPSTVDHHLPDSPEGMLMGHVNLRENKELCQKGSAECYITPELQMAPTLILHGTKDRTVNTYESVQLYEKMKSCGKQVELYLLEGADHGGAEFWTEDVCRLVDEFAQDCMKVESIR